MQRAGQSMNKDTNPSYTLSEDKRNDILRSLANQTLVLWDTTYTIAKISEFSLQVSKLKQWLVYNQASWKAIRIKQSYVSSLFYWQYRNNINQTLTSIV